MILDDYVEKVIFSPILKEDENSKVKQITPALVKNGKIDISCAKTVSSSRTNDRNRDLSIYYIRKGDILFLSKGSQIYSILVEKDYHETVACQLYYVLRIKKDYNPVYINWYLNSPLAKEYYEKNSSKSTTKFINKNAILNLDIIYTEDEDINTVITKFEEEKQLTLDYLRKKEIFVTRELMKRISDKK